MIESHGFSRDDFSQVVDAVSRAIVDFKEIDDQRMESELQVFDIDMSMPTCVGMTIPLPESSATNHILELRVQPRAAGDLPLRDAACLFQLALVEVQERAGRALLFQQVLGIGPPHARFADQVLANAKVALTPKSREVTPSRNPGDIPATSSMWASSDEVVLFPWVPHTATRTRSAVSSP